MKAMKVLHIDPPPDERLLAGFTHDTDSRPFGIAITDRAFYFPELNRWSLKEPWVVRRLPNGQVRHVVLRRTRALPILILAMLMIAFGGVLTFLMLLPIVHGEAGEISGWPVALLVGGFVLPFAARGRRTLRVAFTDRKDFQWKPPFAIDRASKERLQAAFDKIASGFEAAHIRVIHD